MRIGSYTNMKRVPCRVCKKVHPNNHYLRQKRKSGGCYINRVCKKCAAARAIEYYRRDPIKGRARQKATKLKMAYGMTMDELNIMLTNQGGKCAICRSSEPRGRGRFHVDHDHTSGKIRGLLCHHCNVGLGNFKDDVKILQTAIEYLK